MKSSYLEQNLSSFWELNDRPRTQMDSSMTKPLVRRSRQCQKPLQITLHTDFPNPVNIHVVITSPSIVHGLRRIGTVGIVGIRRILRHNYVSVSRACGK